MNESFLRHRDQTAAFVSTYAADVSGVCSALYELGGMTVMHDASGCNSTYNTHDEPRWYDHDSYVFISALTEMEAVMGDDEKLVRDIVNAAGELSPKFIAVAGTPIPALTGFDFEAAALRIESLTGIPSFGLDTNGMNTYVLGASKAFAAVADRFVYDSTGRTDDLSVNLLGVTPLDFSVNGSVGSVRELLNRHGVSVVSCFAMGSGLDEIALAGQGRVNLVMSYSGMKTAELLRKRFGTPYVAGRPFGSFGERIVSDIRYADETGECVTSCRSELSEAGDILVIGETVASMSLAQAIRCETGRSVMTVCATEADKRLLGKADVCTRRENELLTYISASRAVIADPLYEPLCRIGGARLVPLPHEGFSGRIFRTELPDMTDSIDHILSRL